MSLSHSGGMSAYTVGCTSRNDRICTAFRDDSLAIGSIFIKFSNPAKDNRVVEYFSKCIQRSGFRSTDLVRLS